MNLFSTPALFTIIHAVGWVLVPLALLGGCAFALIAERVLVIARTTAALHEHTQAVIQPWTHEPLHDAAVRSLSRLESLARDHVLRAWIEPLCTAETIEHAALWWIETQLEVKATRIEKSLNRGLWLLDTVITAAPLVGLFGTVTGMMEAFRLIGGSGLVNPTGVSGGVAQALIATAIGLVIAVISLIAFNALTQRVDSTIDELQAFGSQWLAALRVARERSSPVVANGDRDVPGPTDGSTRFIAGVSELRRRDPDASNHGTHRWPAP
jgi:biopolymer transport protein ExbB